MNLEQARTRAFERLKTNRRKARPYEMALVAGLALAYDVSPGIWGQLDRDLRLYPFFDCLAMWLDLREGLAATVPEMMEVVATLFLYTEQEKEGGFGCLPGCPICGRRA